jgi:hypothetical protein
MPADGGTPKPITPEGTVGTQVTPDGERVLVKDPEDKYFLYPLHGNGSASGVPQLKTDDGVIASAADGHTLFVREAVLNAWTMRVVSVDINTGKRQLFKEIEPPDRAGVLALGPVHITPDGKTYVFGSRAGSQTCMSWKDYADSLRSMVRVAAPGTGCSFRHKKIAILAPAITTLAS